MQINIGQPIVATAGAPRKSGWWNKPVFNSTLKHTTIVIVTMILTSAVHWINDKTSQESRAAAVPLPPAATILDASAPIAGTISPVVTLAPIAEPAPSASGRPVRRAP
jgi:hypothetical protein